MSWLEKIGLGSSAQSISPEEAHQLQQSGKLTIVDVRDPSEWAATGIH